MTDRNPDRECQVRVGETVISLVAPDTRLARRLRNHFRAHAPSRDPDVRLTIEIDRRNTWSVPHSLFVNKTVTGDLFEIGGGIVRGTYSSQSREAAVRVGDLLLTGRLIRVFEQLVYQAFYSDPRNRKGSAFLLHSAGVIRGDAGYVFTGSSGAGKSTVARLSSHDRVLNDEICQISLERGGAVVGGTPFNGFFKAKAEGSAPLESVFLLSHAGSHSIRPLSESEVVSSLLPQIVPPIGLHERITRDTLRQMLDLMAGLQRRVPVMGLAFRRDAGFWRQIDELRHTTQLGGWA